MKIRFLCVVYLGFCSFGCSSLKKDHSKVKHTEAASIDFVAHSEYLTQKNSVVKDSLDANFELEIWPKGKFLFSAQGFEGEATRLSVKGRVAKLHGSILKQSTEIVEDKKVRETMSKTLDATKLDKSRKATSFSLWTAFVVLLAVLLFWLWLRRKRLWFT